MRDNRTRFRAIRAGMMQIYPKQLTGRMTQPMNVLALFISGIVGSGSTQGRQVARKAPTAAKPESRIKQLSRWNPYDENRYEL